MCTELDVAFLGGLFPKEKEQEIINKSIGGIQNAANSLQWKIIEGLDINLQKPVKIINALFVGSYPRRYKDLIVKKFVWKHTNNSDDLNVGFVNLTGYKYISRIINIKRSVKAWAKQNISLSKKGLIIYSVHVPFLIAAYYAKKINPEIQVSLIVPDLPEYMNLSERKPYLYRVLKYLEVKYIKRIIRYIDNFILLTEQMSGKINFYDKNYIVIEGMVSKTECEKEYNKSIPKTRDIVYTGTLSRVYGVLNLVNAMKNVKDPNANLVICGSGETSSEIEEIARRDNRIKFLGLLPHDEVLSIQKNATVLVNPRQNIGEYTKYSFPSKTMEYLASGNPVIAYKLDGIPSDYDNYILYVKDNSIEGLANMINDILCLSDAELHEIGLKGKEFILNKKNNILQTKKILNMI